MLDINRKTEAVMYLRGDKNNPLGYIYFKYDNINNTDVICIGWSKVNRVFDKFDKSRGQTIAIKRGYKTTDWAHTQKSFDMTSHIGSIHHSNIPFTLKDNIEMYFDKAKRHFSISSDVVFIISATETNFVFGGDELPTDGKIETKTIYTKILY